MLETITLKAIDDFFQSPDAHVIDELGVIDRQIKELEATKAKLKAKVLERGLGFHRGLQFVAEVQEYDRATISSILVKEYGTKQFVEQVTQVQHVKSVTLKPV